MEDLSAKIEASLIRARSEFINGVNNKLRVKKRFAIDRITQVKLGTAHTLHSKRDWSNSGAKMSICLPSLVLGK